MGKWDDIEFKITSMGSAWIVIRGNVMLGSILTVNKEGIRRALAVGDKLGFDRDNMGRVKFFKGCTPSHMSEYTYGSKVVSSLGWNNREWKLEKSGDVLILRCGGLYVLFITPAGVYRSLNCSGTGLPCDEQGRVMVLK